MPVSYKYSRLLASSRKNSEDRAAVFEHGDALVVVVADGAGGMGGGAVAADALVLGVTTELADQAFDIEDGPGWAVLFADVDAMLAKTIAGETTAVVVAVSPRGVLGVSVGDSEAWVIGSNHMDDLTGGQSKKRLGSGRAAPVFFSRPALEGVLIVGTDGLFNYTTAEKIAEAVREREPADASERLRALVQLPSGRYQDDFGVVVVRRMCLE